MGDRGDEMTAPIDLILDGVQWKAEERTQASDADGLPHVTHSGVLDIAGFQLKVYRLSDGQAVIDADDMHRFFDGMTK